MTFPLNGPKLKIERAQQKVVELEAICREFFARQSLSLVVEHDPRIGHKVAKLQLDVPLPAILHVLTGEIIYHLRSILDQIAVAFGRMSSAKPNVKSIYFPTGDSLRNFRTQRRDKLKGVDADLIKQIIKLKPYDGGDDTLRAIFRMANFDKHLELIPISPAGDVNFIYGFKISHAIVAVYADDIRSLNDGIVISVLGEHGTITPRNHNAGIHVIGEVLLGNVSLYEGKPLVRFLKELTSKAAEVYNKLASYCAATARF